MKRDEEMKERRGGRNAGRMRGNEQREARREREE